VAAKNASYRTTVRSPGWSTTWSISSGQAAAHRRETPYPYGVYGTPDGTPTATRAAAPPIPTRTSTRCTSGAPTTIRTCDALLPHVRDRSRYPQRVKTLDAAGYLERAFQTARAFYIYPYEIFPTYYETTSGPLQRAGRAEAGRRPGAGGFAERAAWLRASGKRKSSTLFTTIPIPSARVRLRPHCLRVELRAGQVRATMT